MSAPGGSGMARRPPPGARLCDGLLFPAYSSYLHSTEDVRLGGPGLRLAFARSEAAGTAVVPAAPVAPLQASAGRMLMSPVGGSESSEEDEGDEFHDADDGFGSSTRGLTAAQAAALARLHRDIRRLPPARRDAVIAHATTDADLLRFLRVRGFDAERALAALTACVEWRAATPEVVDPSWARHSAIMALGMSMVYGTDRQGHPLWVVRPELHSPRNSDACVSCTYTLLEHIIGLMSQGIERCTVIFDMKGFGFANYDIRWVLTCISALRNYYPERLARAVVTSTPLAFRVLWQAVQPFMDAAMIARVVLLDDDFASELHKLVDTEFLPPRLGGTARVCNVAYGHVLCAGGTQEEAERAALAEGARATVTV